MDQLRALQGTKVAVLVRELHSGERKGRHKVSLRATDDDVDVSVIARAQGGGGHRRAAGFSTTLELDELIPFLRGAIAAQLHPSADGHAGRHARLSALRPRAMAARAPMDGVLLIDKPAGITSHDVVAAAGARWAASQHGPRGHARPVRHRPADRAGGHGHEGAEQLMELPKRYETVAQLGARLEHGRPRGRDHGHGPGARPTPRAADREIRQRPPRHSAVKIGGERAYRRARRGERFEMPERIVTVHALRAAAGATRRAAGDAGRCRARATRSNAPPEPMCAR